MAESQRVVLLVFSGVLGLLVGSFLNVCIFRLPRNCMSLVRPRSRCPRCLHLIAWYDNIPVASWLVLGARCRHCRAPISPRYILVELLTGALFLYAAGRQLYGVPDPGFEQALRFAVHAWFLGALIVCTFIDLEFRILPDEVTLPGILIAMAASAVFPAVHAGPLPSREVLENEHLRALFASGIGAAVGGGTVYLIGVVAKIVFRKRIAKLGETEAMGFGDVKYMAMIGALLGWKGVLFTFLLGCLFGSIFGIGRAIAVRRMGYVPFGPFLSLGALVMLFAAPLIERLLNAYMKAIGPRQ